MGTILVGMATRYGRDSLGNHGDRRNLPSKLVSGGFALIPALSCRSCRPNAPFAELVQLSRTSIADEMRF
jgi:hypothetical protein